MVNRLYIEKRDGFCLEAAQLLNEFNVNQGISALKGVRVFKRYDIEDIAAPTLEAARFTIFAEPNQDIIYDEQLPSMDAYILHVAYLPGQFDQRADSASQCVQLLSKGERPLIRTAQVYALHGNLRKKDLDAIRGHLINPVESCEVSAAKPSTLKMTYEPPKDVEIIKGFITMGDDKLAALHAELGLSMSMDDLRFVRDTFNREGRGPTMTELRVLDTYWSDHCRHTTFLTVLDSVEIEEGPLSAPIAAAYDDYLAIRDKQRHKRDICLMDVALAGMRALKKQGALNDLDESDEVNACSIVVNAHVDGKSVPYLLMFKNETHNHPTEIEPFGGAATCLGGAIRDPLSGRAYVYQAMRISGAGDPRVPVKDTLPGKLPQRKLVDVASRGYSAYGNQVGVATGHVKEYYHPGYVAKHLELGAVVGAAPQLSVMRRQPTSGDIVMLVGGPTGRDGIGGATGSSKSHTEESLATCGAEVQKGNAPTERALQRLFRDHKFIRLIKKCNDFGAGGLSVAIGELAPGIYIDLDAVPTKYEGLDSTELAISESQERMACVIDPVHMDEFVSLAHKENLDATRVAVVTSNKRVQMSYKGRRVVNLARAFLDTNGVKQHRAAFVSAPDPERSHLLAADAALLNAPSIADAWLMNLSALNVCSQRGLIERFDNSIGAGTVLYPFGGRRRATPAECMIAKLPTRGETTTCSIMAHGYNPNLSAWSPFHGAAYAVLEAVAKIAAAGGDVKGARLTLQEYFERLGEDARRWGKPLAALLGAMHAQLKLGVPAIGGKDSMSGSFGGLDVPPTLVAFAVACADARAVISPEFKKTGSRVYLMRAGRDDAQLPDFAAFLSGAAKLRAMIAHKSAIAAHTVGEGGVAAAISKMMLGNAVGFKFAGGFDRAALFTPDIGSIVVEAVPFAEVDGAYFTLIGTTTEEPVLTIGEERIPIEAIAKTYDATLEGVYPTRAPADKRAPFTPYTRPGAPGPAIRTAQPKAVVLSFPGTNSETDTESAFIAAGAKTELVLIRNRVPSDIEDSIKRAAAALENAHILALPGGFSAGDEPDGSGKFIATFLRAPRVRDAVMALLNARGGLALGICNGFQALIKVGLLPYGEIRDVKPDDPTLTFNAIGRHVACVVDTVVASTLSPWLYGMEPGTVHAVPVSHGEGRFVANERWLSDLAAAGQIATQYAGPDGAPNPAIPYCPNGSAWAVEGITSPDGRVYGKMAHSERAGAHVGINIGGTNQLCIFKNGVDYFR